MENAVTVKNDIKYRGPITYRGLRFIALIAMTLSQFSIVVSVVCKAITFSGMGDPGIPNWVFDGLGVLGQITFPLLLIASFATVFSRTDGIKKVLLTNFLLAALTFVFCAFFLESVIATIVEGFPVTFFKVFDMDKLIELLENNPGILKGMGLPIGDASSLLNNEVVNALLSAIGELDISGLLAGIMPHISKPIAQYIIANYININIFWDLFLCTAFYFFISYKPKKITGRKLLLFRCCAVLPALYIIAATFVDGLNKNGNISLPTWAVALLPNRKISCYILFFLIVLFFKYKEAAFADNGGTYEGFLESLDSRRSSLSFSAFTSIATLAVCGIDYLLKDFQILSFWGMGKSYKMFIAIPFIMLFSFNKRPKHRWPDVFVPVYYIIHYAVLVYVCVGGAIALPAILEVFLSGGNF